MNKYSQSMNESRQINSTTTNEGSNQHHTVLFRTFTSRFVCSTTQKRVTLVTYSCSLDGALQLMLHKRHMVRYSSKVVQKDFCPRGQHSSADCVVLRTVQTQPSRGVAPTTLL